MIQKSLNHDNLNMRLLCLSDLHLRSEAVVDAIDRQHLSPFLAQIAATVAEVSPDAAALPEGRKRAAPVSPRAGRPCYPAHQPPGCERRLWGAGVFGRGVSP